MAVLSTVAVLLASLKLAALDGRAPVLMIFLVPIILSAYAGGLGPGLTATVLAALFANYFILPPTHSFHVAYATDEIRWGLLLVIGLLVSAMSEALHRSRRRAEENWGRYAVTLGSIGDAVITTDRQGRITLLNREAERLTGWTNAEAGGQPLPAVFRIINENTRQTMENPVKKVLDCGAVVGLANHTVLVARNGKETPIDDSAAPIKKSDGEIIGVVLVFRDCAERKKTADALALFRTLIDQSNDGIEVVDPATGRFLDVNEHACLNLGYTREEMLTLTVFEIDPAINPALREQTLKRLRETGSLIVESVHRRKDGTTFPVELNKKLIQLDREYLVTVARNITERKRMEEDLRRKKALFEALVNSSPDGILAVDGQGQTILQNPQFNKLWKIPSHIAEKTADAELLRYVFDSLKHPEPFMEKVRHLYAHPEETSHDEIELKDGRFLDRNSAAVLDENNNYYGRIWTFRDVSERKQSEQTLEFVAQNGWALRHEDFLAQLVEHIGQTLGVDYAFVGRLKDLQTVQTIGLYAKGKMVPDIEYSTRGAPCQNVVGKVLCHYGEKLQELFPEDSLLGQMGAQSYLGIPLADSSGKPVGLMAVLDTKPMPDSRLAAAVLQIAAIRAAGELERLAADTALLESENLYRSLISASPDAVTVTNVKGQITFVSNRALEIFGHASKDEVIGRHLFDWVMSEEHEIARASFQELLGGKPIRGSEFTLLKKDGTRFNGEINAAPLSSAGGTPEGIILITRDITERKRADEMQKRLATAVEQAAEDIIITDDTGKILYVNPAFETITGYSREAVIGCNPRILKSDKHDAAFYQKMWSVLRRGQVWSGRVINKRKDGTFFEQESTISPIRDSAGKITNYVGVRRDVTREVALETQLRQSQKMDAIGQLAGGIAHDFNNLLTAIRGNASLLLLNNDSPSTEATDCVQQIVEAAERAANLTRQLLMFSRKQVIQPIRLDLNEVVAQMTKLLQRILGEDVSLASNYAAGLPLIHADTGMIEQILLNLAVNSRDAMPKGGQLTITTGTESFNPEGVGHNPGLPAGLYVRLTVADTGCGVAREILPRIFEPFFTTKEVGKGTGLGLATVHGIVQQHNGRITVTSEINKGTTFRIYFPVVSGTPAEMKTRSSISTLPRGTETILVVEDEVIVRLAVSNMLQRFGYTVLAAGSGVEALTVWKNDKDRIHLLLTDIVMPDGMTGYELACQLQAEKPRLKIIYTSGYSGDLADKRLRMIEGVNFLQKPYAPRKLAEALRKNLDPE